MSIYVQLPYDTMPPNCAVCRFGTSGYKIGEVYCHLTRDWSDISMDRRDDKCPLRIGDDRQNVIWTEDENGIWTCEGCETEWMFLEGTAQENHVVYCNRCGGRVREFVDYKYDDDEVI